MSDYSYKQPKWAKGVAIRASGLMEDICECGVGHPNTDWIKKNTAPSHLTVHGCCGCCDTRGKK